MKTLMLNRNKYIVEKSKYLNSIKVASGVTIAILSGLLLIFASTSYGSTNNNKISSNEDGKTTFSAIIPSTDKNEQQTQETQPDETKPEEKYLVTKVVDGDTIYVSGIETRIRLIGINTPETVDSTKPIQCYGPEASDYLKQLILGKYVGLESDEASGDTDKYGRPLRYIYFNGENINQKILSEGYGKEASYGSEYKYRSQFVAAENDAKSNNRGLWSPSTCNGQE